MAAPSETSPRSIPWIDIAALQLTGIWLTDWITHTIPLMLMAICGAVAYLLWTLSLTQSPHARKARCLLAASVIGPICLQLLLPAQMGGSEVLQLSLLAAAGFELSASEAWGDRRRERTGRTLPSNEELPEHPFRDINPSGS
ncbi:hypothetical protein Pla123a_10390 [Posidoniimonas polymericola]|uniref:Uncharacterized protein n=1 Tax=Posidoniimonas polymericola TaxID=2528002 RepID=A0A5C5YTG7_9BACT|nr:hypothetical protein Pla123a_10390 [Posidoniimonas polymericola]